MIRLAILVVCLGFLAESQGYRAVNICEHRRRSIGCRHGMVLSIIGANYGRTDRRTCPSRAIRTTGCRSSRSLVKVRQLCNGKRSCHLWASNRVYGDPCWGTYKYLRVVYRCYRRPRPRFPTVNICEHRRRSIGCRHGMVLSIIGANYGRTDRRTCQSRAIRTTGCRSSRSLVKVRQLCNGKRSCHLWASNRVYGDPCWGTYKYLRVVYRCYRRPRPRFPTVNICEHRRRSIGCRHGMVLSIIGANYGRTDRRTCPSRAIRTTGCRSSRSLVKVRQLCNGKRSCHLWASNRVYGDPCWGTYKYLRVVYRCYRRPRPTRRRSITCEGKVARLVCPFRQKLKILHANYGRSIRSYCRRANFLNTRCRACRSLSTVRRRCDRRRSCAVPATNRVFGDPCRGTYKYLDITYQCA